MWFPDAKARVEQLWSFDAMVSVWEACDVRLKHKK